MTRFRPWGCLPQTDRADLYLHHHRNLDRETPSASNEHMWPAKCKRRRRRSIEATSPKSANDAAAQKLRPEQQAASHRP